MTYKIIDNEGVYTIQKDSLSINIDDSSKFRSFLNDVCENGWGIVEGPDVISESYDVLRANEYPSSVEQHDMQYWDSINGTSIWLDTIQSIKDKYPKTIVREVTIGDIPQVIIDKVEEYCFKIRLSRYKEALSRLDMHLASEGCDEITKDIVVSRNFEYDESGSQILDNEGNPVYTDVIETVTIPAIEPVTDQDLIDEDLETRAEAQAIIDSTPQEVIDAYNQENTQ